MSASLSLKNVSDDVVERLRRRAAANHRSMQGELMAILTETVGTGPVLSPFEILERARAHGYRSPSSSVDYIREDRDEIH